RMVGKYRTSDGARIEHQAAAGYLPHLLIVAVSAQYDIGARVLAQPGQYHLARCRNQPVVMNFLEQKGGIVIRGTVNGEDARRPFDSRRKLAKGFALLRRQRRVCKLRGGR